MKLYLSVFSFDSRIDFQSGYVRIEIYCDKEATLRTVFEKIPAKFFGYQEFGVDKEFIHCRINGIAVLEDVSVEKLVARFGNSWTIEPLSKRYAKKDLLLDLDLAIKKYDAFFQLADFVYPGERKELSKYLLINFIAESHDEDYYGDGFFLYVKWLMGRHPMKMADLLRFISHKDHGLFSHVPVSSLMFPANSMIDDEIQSLQSQLVNGSRCPIHRAEWVFLGKQLDSKYGFTCANKIEITGGDISRCPIFSKDMGDIDVKGALENSPLKKACPHTA